MKSHRTRNGKIHEGDCLSVLPQLPAKSAHCVVTSPPYYALRDYQMEQQIGMESSPAEYVERMVEVFRGIRHVLRDDGCVWLNVGDSYSAGKSGRDDSGDKGRFAVPRIDPKPGDVLRKFDMVFRVTMVRRHVHYELTQPGKGAMYAIPMQCRGSKPAWREHATRQRLPRCHP